MLVNTLCELQSGIVAHFSLEVAAINNRQRKMGYNAALEFTEGINQHFTQTQEGSK